MGMILAAISAACAAALLIFLFNAKKKAGKYYDEYLEYIDKKEYSLKDLFPAAFYLINEGTIDKIIPNIISKKLVRYKNKVTAKILEIYGEDSLDFYIMVHRANKIILSIVSSSVFFLITAVVSSGGDIGSASMFFLLSIAALVGLGFLLDLSLNKKIEERRTSIRLEFPEFVNKLTLLVNAGMTISKAWEKIVADNKKEGPLYDELVRASAEITAGKPENIAYEDFGKRCKIKEIMKFVSIIVLNLRKGGSEVVPTLRIQGTECWEMRKAEAKRLGEEATSKIMMPLMMMFIGVIIIVATPAILSFSSGF